MTFAIGLFAGAMLGFIAAGILAMGRFSELDDENARLRMKLGKTK